jgi:hypothetical protein
MNANIKNMLDSTNINDIIEALEILPNENLISIDIIDKIIRCFIEQKDYRLFIAERIYKLKADIIMPYIIKFLKNDDAELKFLSAMLISTWTNEMCSSILTDEVKNAKEYNLISISCLLKISRNNSLIIPLITGLNKLTIDKQNFNLPQIDSIVRYVDALTEYNVRIPLSLELTLSSEQSPWQVIESLKLNKKAQIIIDQ